MRPYERIKMKDRQHIVRGLAVKAITPKRANDNRPGSFDEAEREELRRALNDPTVNDSDLFQLFGERWLFETSVCL